MLQKSESRVNEWISQDEIYFCQSFDSLSRLVEKKLKT